MEAQRIIRVFCRRTSLTPTDDMAFVGYPPLWRPVASRVDVSCVFTWDRERALELRDAWAQYYPDVQIGGPAFDAKPNGFTPGMYVKPGVTFTSRGCSRSCEWCFVPEREGELHEYADFAPGYIINDNNFLACSAAHRRDVYNMLDKQRCGVVFAGGLDTRLITDAVAEELRSLRIGKIFLAADTEYALKPLEAAVKRLRFLRTPIEIERQRPAQRLCCYTLIAFNGETISQAEARLRRVWEIGATPCALLYQPRGEWIHYSQEWKELARTWQRPALMMRTGAVCK